MAYSLSPLRNSVRRIVTSLNSIGRIPAELSIVRLTSARPSGERVAVPAKMTSSIFWLRTELGAWAPSTQAMASTTLDLPEPLGPTTTVTPGSSSSVVASANDLKPLSVNVLRNMAPPKLSGAVSAARDSDAGSGPLAHRAPVVAAPGGRPAADDPATAGAATLAGAAVH